jgi:hypothetical protein
MTKDEGGRMKDERRKAKAEMRTLIGACSLSSFIIHPSSFGGPLPDDFKRVAA